MCDQRHTLLFDSNKCEIRREKSGKLVATATRTPNDVYILDKLLTKVVSWKKKMKIDSGTDG